MFGFNQYLVQFLVLQLWAMQYYTFGFMILRVTLVCAAIITGLLTLLTYDYNYWEKRGIFSPPYYPLVGHIKSVVMFKEQGGICFKKIYDTYKDLKFLGTHQFYQRTLVVQDPVLIKRICVNDFQHFVDRGFFFNKDVDPLAESVLFLRGNEWRKLRAKISPIFSPNKLRAMIPLLENTANEFSVRLRNTITKESPRGPSEGPIAATISSAKMVGGFTADAIVPCAFGLKSGVMDNEDDPFAVALHAFYQMTPFNIFEKTMRQFWPKFCLFFRLKIIPQKTHDFFYNIVTRVLRARENGLQEKRGDFLDMMMALRADDKNNNAAVKNEEDYVEITDMIISANAFIIFLGGYETTSSTLAFMFLELAVAQEVQEKMRKEVLDTLQKYDGKICYEMLQELTYMDMVIQETLRLYPPFPSIQRMCTKDYIIPGTSKVIEQGTIVLFPNLGIQRDEQYFERADDFIPERWADGLPNLPPGVYMPFGDGPRYCIGKRFAIIQMKCCLIRVMQHVRISPAKPGPRSGPFEAEPRSPLTLHPADSTVKISLL